MRQTFFWLTVLILLVAAFLRINQLETYPPGPHYDEAANILITRSIAFGGADLFPIANSYQGRESLYFYINVPLFHLVGDDVFVMRLSSMFLNMLTIAASIPLARMMFPGERGRIMALVVGVAMAISFHQIFMSRQAYRAVTLPAMQALGLLFLWRGLRAGRNCLLVVGGGFSAAALYTYMASRLFPLWLGLAALILLWSDRQNWQKRLKQGVVFFGAMGLFSLPLAIYAMQNPDIFFQRLIEVSDGDVTVTLAESVRLHMEMFFVRGEFGNLRYNDPGRPYFTWVEAPFLVIGWLVAVWRVFRSRDPIARAAFGLAILAPLMIIPSVISVAGFPPSHMRSLGMVPLIFLTLAIGVEALVSWVAQVSDGRLRHAVPSILLAGLLLGGISVHQTYLDWVGRTDLFYQADGDLAAAVEWLETETIDAETRVYVSSFHREHPTVIAGTDRAITWLGLDSLILPPPDQAALLLFSQPFPPPESWNLDAIAQPVTTVPNGPDGGPAFWAYSLTEREAVAADFPKNTLVSFLDMTAQVTPSGQQATVTTRWLVNQTPPYYRLRPILNLRDSDGRLLASNDVFLLGTSSWQPGEIVLQEIRLDVPPGTPPGDYALSVSWVDRDTDTFVSYFDADGAHAGIEAAIGTLTVTRPDVFPAPDVLPIDHRHDAIIAEGVRLLGWNTMPDALRAGAWFDATLYFEAVPSTTRPDMLNLQAVLSDESEPVPIWEGALDYAPSSWLDGELVTARVRWRIPYEQAAGTYDLILQADDAMMSLSPMTVEAGERRLQPPPVTVETSANFADALQLHGYSLDVTDSNIQLEMAWQALHAIEADYTLFVHLIDSDGVTIDQYDAMPLQNTYPTSIWAPGEYVVETVSFAVDTTPDLTLRVGFYEQRSGLRLPLMNNERESVNFLEILTNG